MKLPLTRLRPRLLTSLSLMTTVLVSGAGRTAFAQAPDQPQAHKSVDRSLDVSVGVFGQLTFARSPFTQMPFTNDQNSGTTTTQFMQGASPSAGVLGTVHQALSSRFGYNVNVGYTRFAENYSYGQSAAVTGPVPPQPPSTFLQGSIESNTVELTVASVIEGPRTRRFSTFAQLGGGGLFFMPASNTATSGDFTALPKSETRPALLFGVGMNYKLSRHFDLRAEYRGLFYKGPDFNLPPSNGQGFPATRLFTVTNTPAISLAYRFGGKSKP